MVTTLTERTAVRKPVPRGPAGPRGLYNVPQVDGPYLQWQDADGGYDNPSLLQNNLGPEGPSGSAQNFNTYAIAAASIISAGVEGIRTLGYYAVGDGGGARYKEVGSGGQLTTADSRHWQIMEPELNPRMFGAKGDGVEGAAGVWSGTDDTAAFNAMFAHAAGVSVVDPGKYICGALNAITAIRKFTGLSGARIVPKTGAYTSTAFQGEYAHTTAYTVGQSIAFYPTAALIAAGISGDGLVYRCIQNGTNKTPSSQPTYWTVMAFADFMAISASNDAVIDGLEIDLPGLLYPQLRTVSVTGCTNLTLRHPRLPRAGGVGIAADNCKDILIDHGEIGPFARHGIQVTGTTQADSVNNTIRDTRVETSGIGCGNCIGFQNGVDQKVQGGRVTGAHTFGVTFLNVTRGGVTDTTSADTHKEGFNCDQAAYITFTNVKSLYSTGVSIDFGMSITGLSGPSFGIHVIAPNVQGAAFSGICFTGDVSLSSVHGGLILNCNASGTAHEGGILCSGTGCVYNTFSDVRIHDNRATKLHDYGFVEFNKGNGTPPTGLNTVSNLPIVGFVTAATLRS